MSEPTSSGNPAEPGPGPSRRALIASVAGLVAGALAHGGPPSVEAHHGGGTDADALHVDDTNFASCTTDLVMTSSTSRDPIFQVTGTRGPAVVGRSTDGVGGAFMAGDFAMMEDLVSAHSGALYGFGIAPDPPPGVVGAVSRSRTQARNILTQLENINAGVVAAATGNLTSLVAVNFGHGYAVDVQGAMRFSACGDARFLRGQQDCRIDDPHITADSMIVVCFASNPRTTTLRYAECFDGFAIAHLSDAHVNYNIRAKYAVWDCPHE